MGEDARAAAAGQPGPPAAAAQQISEVFRGSAGESPALKHARSVRGIQRSAVPAFVAGQELADLAEADQRIVVLTADLAGAGRTSDFAARHPARFFNMGVAEQNMITVAAGLASAGLIPYVSTFAAYAALLGCEQIRTFELGLATRLTEGDDLTLITTGSEVRPCLDAAALLRADGIAVRVVDMHTISPIDTGEVVAAAEQTAAVMTVEEHNVTGGLGSAVAETLAESGITTRFRRVGVPDEHVILGPPAALQRHYELNADGIAARARRFLAT